MVICKMTKILHALIVASVLLGFLLAAGCSVEEKVPEANDTTCQPNFIKTLKTDTARKTLGTACATRGKYNLAPGKAW